MIDISKLTQEDIGRRVKYIREYCDIENGKIKSWNKKYIFVVYGHLSHKPDWENYTAQATDPADLFDEDN